MGVVSPWLCPNMASNVDPGKEAPGFAFLFGGVPGFGGYSSLLQGCSSIQRTTSDS